jgi:hypothetical protein
MGGQLGAQARECIGRQRGPEDEERQPPASEIAMRSRGSRPDVRILLAQRLCSWSHRQRSPRKHAQVSADLVRLSVRNRAT